jgi:hypothetical protein
MNLSEELKEALIKCSAGIITNEQLNDIINYKVNYIEFKELLDLCYKTNDQSLFEAVLWCMPNVMTNPEKELIFSHFIILPNHHDHENIIIAFQNQFNTNYRNIEVLLNAIKKIPEYLQEDDFKYSYIRKIIYAIGAQPEPYNIQALEKLSKSEDLQIRELALHQIEKRNKLGRWESIKT